MMLCAHSLIKSLDHFPNILEPCRFDLWNDNRRSPWLSSIGFSQEQHDRGNMPVMRFANAFFKHKIAIREFGSACSTLISVIENVAAAYAQEDGLEGLACSHLEELMLMVKTAMNDVTIVQEPEQHAALGHVYSIIRSELTKLMEHDDGKVSAIKTSKGAQIYILVILQGRKPHRFQESPTIPTFFEWDIPSICRVSKPVLEAAARIKMKYPTESWEECICQTFSMPLIKSLRNDETESKVVLKTRRLTDATTDEGTTFISTMVAQKIGSVKSRKYIVRHSNECITEYTVAHKFPHSLSRQRCLVSSEIKMGLQG